MFHGLTLEEFPMLTIGSRVCATTATENKARGEMSDIEEIYIWNFEEFEAGEFKKFTEL